MRKLWLILLTFLLGIPLFSESECDKAKRFLTTYRANVDYHTTHVYANPLLKYLQQSLKLRLRQLEESLDSPSLYELNCKRLFEQVKLRVLQMQAIKDTVAAVQNLALAKQPAAKTSEKDPVKKEEAASGTEPQK